MSQGHPPGQAVPGGGPNGSMANQMHGIVGGPQGQGPVMMSQGGGPGVTMAGPNAHAMSHLNPNAMNHQALFQHQQYQAASKLGLATDSHLLRLLLIP